MYYVISSQNTLKGFREEHDIVEASSPEEAVDRCVKAGSCGWAAIDIRARLATSEEKEALGNMEVGRWGSYSDD